MSGLRGGEVRGGALYFILFCPPIFGGVLCFTVFCPHSAAKRGTARRRDERLAVRGGAMRLLTTDGLSLVKEIPA